MPAIGVDVAKTSTLYRFQIELADIDQNMYESLDLRVPCHPSEDLERLVVRVLARTLAHREGLEFGRGLSHAEDPALWAKTPHGEIDTWIDVGCPSAERLHRASKAAGRVLIFTHKAEQVLRKEWSSRSIHGAADIQVHRFPPGLITDLSAKLERNMQWYCTVQENSLSVGDGHQSVDAPLEKLSLERFLSGA